MKMQWRKTFLLGFGFMAISAVWPLYDAYMPDYLSKYIASSAIIGLIMGLDNFLGLTLQPWIGSVSDRTRTRWGRRRPFLLIGMPIAALALITIPWTLQLGLVALLLTTGVLNLSMSLFRSPTVALMPDLTPPAARSLANGVINFMGGVGAVIVILIGAKLYDRNEGFPFLAAAAVMVIVFFLFLFLIREPDQPAEQETNDEAPQQLLAALKHVVTSPDRTTLVLFLAIMSWFIAYQSVNTWFTKYSVENLDVSIDVAAARLAAYALSFVVFAIPAGYIGTKLGRTRTIQIGLIGMGICFVAMNFITNINEMTIALVVAGLFWSLVNINSYPMVVDMCHPSQTGTYTGLYYIFSGVAGVAGPFLAGSLFDTVGTKKPLFILAAGFMVIATLLIRSLKIAPPARHAPGA